eukprot:TRINITY_DN6560_c0_g1_i3.p2 TRINITY_DN6560_c0_g1~~TRINITY_DN6560_c0_g1_i3.p2  ORF type:complete len:144 (-),score=10.18 TRINITY_DN6560_c0_g1_i3:298-729(-)
MGFRRPSAEDVVASRGASARTCTRAAPFLTTLLRFAPPAVSLPAPLASTTSLQCRQSGQMRMFPVQSKVSSMKDHSTISRRKYEHHSARHVVGIDEYDLDIRCCWRRDVSDSVSLAGLKLQMMNRRSQREGSKKNLQAWPPVF